MGTIVYLIFVFIFLILTFPIFILVWVFAKLFDKSYRVVQETSRFLSFIIIKFCPVWNITVSGKEFIDKKEKYIIICNHQSMLDIPLMAYIPLNFRWVSKREVYKIPLLGWFLWLRDDIGIDRGGLSSTKKMLRTARQYTSKNISLVIYPEGTRSKTGRINQFKEGAFIVAKTTNTQILPIVIDNKWKDNDRGRFGLRLPSKVRLTVLEPIPVETVKKLDIKELAVLTRSRIEGVYKEISGVGYENDEIIKKTDSESV